MDLLLDETSHDLIFTNGACPVTASAKPTVAQRLKINLQTYLGEWFLDQDAGIPYHQKVFGKQLSKIAVDLIFQTAILETPGVIELLEFSSSIDTGRRVYAMTFVVRTSEGPTEPITIAI